MVADLPPTNASSAAAPAQDPAQVAQREFTALQRGIIDRSHYSLRLTNSLSDAEITTTKAYLAKLGDLKRMGLNATRRINAESVYTYIMVCADGNAQMTLSLNDVGLIDGMFFSSWPCTVSASCPGWPPFPFILTASSSGYGDPEGPNSPNPNGGGYNPPPDPPAPR
jgi:hypothetical protein